MLTFAAAVFFLIITPGPGVLTTAGVGSAFGTRSGVLYVTGLFIGTNLVALAVVTGLGALLMANPYLRTLLFIASTCYLLFLAWRIFSSGAKLAFIEAKSAPGIGNGIALQMINPKAYAVNTSLFSGFSFLPDSFVTEIMIKFLIVNAIWIPIHLFWLYLGITLHRLALPDRTLRVINFAMGMAMLFVVALAAWGFLHSSAT